MSDAPETLTICKEHDAPILLEGGCECKDVALYVRKDVAQRKIDEANDTYDKQVIEKALTEIAQSVEVRNAIKEALRKAK